MSSYGVVVVVLLSLAVVVVAAAATAVMAVETAATVAVVAVVAIFSVVVVVVEMGVAVVWGWWMPMPMPMVAKVGCGVPLCTPPESQRSSITPASCCGRSPSASSFFPNECRVASEPLCHSAFHDDDDDGDDVRLELLVLEAALGNPSCGPAAVDPTRGEPAPQVS